MYSYSEENLLHLTQKDTRIMCCSSSSIPYLLSFASICFIFGLGALTIGFATDNWVRYTIDREALSQHITDTNQEELFNSNEEYFSRTRGLWTICFYGEDVPSHPYEGMNITQSLIDKPCRKIRMQIDETMSSDETTRIHLIRLCLGLFGAGFFLFIMAFFTGLSGCWKRSSGCTVSTGILVLFGGLFAAAGIAVFHGYEYMEAFELTTANFGFKRTWSEEVIENTKTEYWWSYMIAWIGVGLVIIAAFFFFAAHHAMQTKKHEYQKQSRYLVPVYPMEKSLPRGGMLPPPPGMYYAKGQGQPMYDNRPGTLQVYQNQAFTAPQYGAYYYPPHK